MTAHNDPASVPGWLRFVLKADRAGSSWYVGTGFFFAPVLALVGPWPAVTAAIWVGVGLAGLWLGLLGIAMAVGLTMAMRSNTEIPEDFWRSIVDYPAASEGRAASPPTSTSSGSPTSSPSRSWC